MNRKLSGSIAAVAVLALGIAACSSSPSTPKAGSGPTMGQTLTIVTTPISPMTDNFNPFVPTSTGYVTHAVNLYNQPLMVFNTQKPLQPPVPELATHYSWSSDGKTLTITTRSGVKWSDGKPFSASDVAFTFNLIKKHPALNANWTIPVPARAKAANSTTAVLTFSQPQLASSFYILQVPIVPQHIWQSVSSPESYADSSPVGMGPYVLDHFSSTGYTMKINPHYYGKSSLHVLEISFPAYASNANLLPPIADGTIDWGGISIIGVSQNYLGKSPHNNTWTRSAPYFSDNNVSVKGDPGTNGPNVWTANLNKGTFSSAIHWGAQGLTPYFTYNNWMNYTLSAPVGKTAGANYGRFSNPAAQSALAAYANATTQSGLKSATTRLANIQTSQVPVAPLLQGASWAQFSTRNYTGWPTASNPYMDPGPNIPEILVVVQRLKPVG